MSELVISMREKVKALQVEMAKLPQMEFPTEHFFADGMYCRILTQCAGGLVVGKVHRREHFFILCCGTMRVNVGEIVQEVTGPCVFVSKPGTKRAILALTDVTYLTVHRTKLRNVEEIDRVVTEPDETSLFDAYNRLKPWALDREDYRAVVAESGYTNEEIQKFCTNEADQIPMPPGFHVETRDSPIHGKGNFVTRDFKAGEIIAPVRIGAMRTPCGRYTNHSKNPNTRYIRTDDDQIVAEAMRDIPKGSEITVNYRETALFSAYPFRRVK